MIYKKKAMFPYHLEVLVLEMTATQAGKTHVSICIYANR